MRTPVERKVNRVDVLKSAFECLMENGLEKTSTRLLSEYTGLKSSSLYYWFKDKDDLIVEATEFGLSVIVEKSLKLAMQYIDDMEMFFKEFILAFKEYTKASKLIIHVASSPTYGQRLVGENGKFEKLYYDFTIKLAETLGVEYAQLRPIVNLFIATINDCAIWEQWDKFENQVNYLAGLISNLKSLHGEK